jgi:hypothetical protein
LEQRDYLLTLETLLPRANDFKDFPNLKDYLSDAKISKRVQTEIADDLKTKEFEYDLFNSLCI